MRKTIHIVRARKYLSIFIVFIVSLLIASFIVSHLGLETGGRYFTVLDENAKVIARSPLPPSIDYIFGTDRNGNDFFYMMISGAKYTILTAIIITVLRIIIGSGIGIILSIYLKSIRHYVQMFLLPFKYIPSLMIALYLMSTFVFAYKEVGITKVVVAQMIILVIIAIPSVISWISDIMDQLHKTSYVQSSYLLGASSWHVIRKQCWPHIKLYGGILFLQQFLQTLMLMMYLAIFEIFIGGSVFHGIFGRDNLDVFASATNEWAGVIGQNLREIILAPWLVLVPLFCFYVLTTITSFAQKELELKIQNVESNLPIKEDKQRNEKIVPSFVLLNITKNQDM